MTKYLLVDTLNMFFRAKHMAPAKADTWTKIGFALHICMSIVNKSYKKENADHVVFCLEGSSWRKHVYKPYKRNRVEMREALSDKQQEEDEEMFNALKDFTEFLRENTNVTVLQNDLAEADDLIARWIHKHPQSDHVILSSDTDFLQLISPTVHQYNGVANQIITLEGYFDDYGRRVKDKKTGEHKPAPDPKWELFEKCMRGDTSDNVFSAYPGVRKKGTKKKVGLIEAYEDKNKGYTWNNLMLQRWTDHEGVEHRVLDDYERNVQLIDLTAQPADIKEFIDTTVDEFSVPKNNKMVGRYFLRFCGKYELKKLSDFSDQYTTWLKANYEY